MFAIEGFNNNFAANLGLAQRGVIWTEMEPCEKL